MEQREYQALATLIYQKAGIKLGDNKLALVNARIGKRLRALGLSNAKEYLQVLANDQDGTEIVQLLDVISTNFTSFYREPSHFDLLGDLLSKWAAQGQTRFRIWCAASSTGEEPYTIAMTVDQALARYTHDTRILATDISTRVLALAQNGQYTADKLESVPASLRNQYFERVPNTDPPLVRADQKLKSMISFRRLNLSQIPFPMKGPMDVILCRNVMIYFDTMVRSRLVAEAFRLLKPGGYFLVGHSESLSGLNSGLRMQVPSVYCKP